MSEEYSNSNNEKDIEVIEAINRIINSSMLPAIVNYLFPESSVENFQNLLREVESVDSFQSKVMMPIITTIVKKTMNQFSFSGIENLSNETKGIIISNHRDIILDAALLNMAMMKNGLQTCEISFGDNLISGQFTIDIGRINKMFRVVRGGTMHELYKNSLNLSTYLRHAILQKKESVWIAQRSGRTKDGFDRTSVAMIKMFALCEKTPFVENLEPLHITPMAISYEYEPCDFLKTKELYISHYQKYEKTPNEDLESMIAGVMQPKGDVNITITQPITRQELEYCCTLGRNEQFNELAKIIDYRILKNYKLFKTNYIAADLLNQTNQFSAFYSEEDKLNFESYMQQGLEKINGNQRELQDIFLKIYATPVFRIQELE